MFVYIVDIYVPFTFIISSDNSYILITFLICVEYRIEWSIVSNRLDIVECQWTKGSIDDYET